MSLKDGIKDFQKTLKQKTKKGYCELEMKLGKQEEEPAAKKATLDKKYAKSKLDDSV